MSLLAQFLQQRSQEYTHMKLGLSRIRETLQLLNNPHLSYPSLLIAGTNGKGSVGRMLESVLLNSGHFVGLYSSPHLQRFEERIRIGGKEITSEMLEKILEDFAAQKLIDTHGCMQSPSGEELSWFEKITVLAFEAFRRSKIQLALLEVGLGGRLDATNVVDPLVSLITSISLDHCEVLGNSVFDIAREKAGVLRRARPLVIGPMEEKLQQFLSAAARLEGAEPILTKAAQGSNEDFSYRTWQHLSLGLKGAQQLKNAATAIETLEILHQTGFSLTEKSVREGLASLRFAGRNEWMETKVPILLDGAHNEEAILALANYLKQDFAEQKFIFILGMMKEKDPLSSIRALAPLAEQFYFVRIDSPRSMSLEDWKLLCKSWKFNGEFFEDSSSALQAALQNSKPNQKVVVTGSLYLIGEIRECLALNVSEKHVNLS